jgi:hypothetical protein
MSPIVIARRLKGSHELKRCERAYENKISTGKREKVKKAIMLRLARCARNRKSLIIQGNFVRLLVSDGEIMFFKGVNEKSQELSYEREKDKAFNNNAGGCGRYVLPCGRLGL